MHPNTHWLIPTWVCKKILDLEKGCTYVRYIHWEIDQENDGICTKCQNRSGHFENEMI